VDRGYAADRLAGVQDSQPGCLSFLSPNEDTFLSPGLERAAIADLESPDVVTQRFAQTLLQNRGSAAAHLPQNAEAASSGSLSLPSLTMRLVRIGLRTQASPLHEPCDAAMNAMRHAGNFGVTGRWHAPEYEFALAVDHIEAIHSQGTKVRVEIYRPAKALHEN
jgi:hypothetical protein